MLPKTLGVANIHPMKMKQFAYYKFQICHKQYGTRNKIALFSLEKSVGVFDGRMLSK